MLVAFVTAFSIPTSPDTFAPTFQRLSTRFGNVLSRETSASSGDLALLISLRALDFRVCHWQWTILWTILRDGSSDSILLNPSWSWLRTSIFRDAFREKYCSAYSARSLYGIVHVYHSQIFQCTQNRRPLDLGRLCKFWPNSLFFLK